MTKYCSLIKMKKTIRTAINSSYIGSCRLLSNFRVYRRQQLLN